VNNDAPIEQLPALGEWLNKNAAVFFEQDAQCPDLLPKIAADGWRLLAIIKAMYPGSYAVAHQTVIDALARWANIAGIDDDEAQAIIVAAQDLTAVTGDGTADAPPDAARADGGSERPTIRIVGGKLPQIVDEAESALIAAAPDFYRYGGQLVRPVLEEVPAADMTRTKIHRLTPITRSHLVDVLTAAARWEKFDKRSESWVSINCPDQIADTYLNREGRWRLPPLVGVINTPFLRADGSILDRPGYDARTALLYRCDGTAFGAVPDRPTRQEADRALRRLEDLVSTFPFASGADGPDRSVAMSAILSALDRRAVPTTPLHGFSAPVAGSGKSMLVDLASMIATGRRAPVIDQSKDDAETDKRLVATLLRGSAITSIDNIERPLESALLCQALTTVGTMQLRILGYSRDQDVPNNAMFYVTGNNLTLAGDLTRRSVVCRLDAGCERPELREFPSDPVEAAKERRAELVVAALTVLRAYFVAEDRVTITPLGSFEAWSRRVREAIVWLGRPDPCDTMASVRRADPVTAGLAALFAAWRTSVGVGRAITVQALVEMASRVTPDGGAFYPDLRDALVAIAGEARGTEINVRRLGKFLGRNEDRVLGGVKITRRAVTTSTVQWVLSDV
jgi:putative DNA primase/helicase